MTSPSARTIRIVLGTPLAEVEALVLEATLRMTKGNKTQAARILGINPTTVFRKLRKLKTTARPKTEATIDSLEESRR